MPRWSTAQRADAPLARKDAALLALLALQPEPSRDRIAAWLWPDAPLAGAQLNLRQRLHRLRRDSGHGVVEPGVALRRLPGLLFDLDQAPLDPDAGALLGDLDFGDLGDFDEWLQGQRQQVLLRRADAWTQRVATLDAAGRGDEALALARRLVDLAPGHEGGWRALARQLYLRGDRTGALATLQRFDQTVCVPQGLRPSAETLALRRTVEQTDARAAGPGPLPASLLHPPLLVGRDAELTALRAAWATGRAVLLLGDGGIGKSRLLAEALRDRRGMVCVRARPGDAGVSYASAVALLAQVQAGFSVELGAAARAELARLLPGWGAPSPHPAQEPVLWLAIESLLQAAQAAGLDTLAVDDLHLADRASFDLLTWLVASPRLQGLRWALAARPDENTVVAQALPGWVAESGGVERLRLQPLDDQAIGQLLESLSLGALPGLDMPPAQRSAALLRHAGGHPFFTLETLKALLLSPPADAALPRPAAAAQLIERRLQALSKAAAELLGLLALADGELDAEAAAAVLERRPLDLAAAWAELEQAQLVSGQAIAHDLLRETALARLPMALRPALHHALVRVLAARGDAPPARLAEHWAAAGRWAEAAAALRQAAAAARLAGRLPEQAALLQRAAQAHDQAAEPDDAFGARADAVAVTLLLHGDAQALQQLDALEPQATGATRRARWLVLRAEALLNLSRFDEARDASAGARELATSGSREAADALSLHGRALALTGRCAEGVTLLRQALQAARADGDAQRQVLVGAALAHALVGDGQRGAALRAQQRVVELSRGGDETELAVHLANLATLAMVAGDTAGTLAHAREAATRLQLQQADGAQARYNAIIRARAAAAMGRLDEAWDSLQPLLAAPPSEGPAATIPTMARVTASGLALWMGDTALARDLLPPLQPQLNPLALAGLLLAHQRVQAAAGTFEGEAWRALHALDRQSPGLLDDPALCIDWVRWLPPAQGLERLNRVRALRNDPDCAGMDRALALCALRLHLKLGQGLPEAELRRLAASLPEGVYVGLYPPESWWTLAEALQPVDTTAAAAARQQARLWLQQAQLPLPASRRLAFERHHPLNRVILGHAGVTAQ